MTIRFGFDFGSDNSVTYPGWYIKWAKVWCLQPPTGTGERSKPIPQSYVLFEARPNPAKDRVEISFAIPEATPVELSIYDVTGRLVKNLYRGTMTGGSHELHWDGRDFTGHDLPSGLYFVRMHAAGITFSRKMILVR